MVLNLNDEALTVSYLQGKEDGKDLMRKELADLQKKVSDLRAIELVAKEFKAAVLAHVKTIVDGPGGSSPVVTYDEMRLFEQRMRESRLVVEAAQQKLFNLL